MINVLVVDDHELVRSGIRSLIAEIAGITVQAEAKCGEDAIPLAKEQHPDIILMDLKMPGIGGLEATCRILRNDPDSKIIILSATKSTPYPLRTLQAGASGYLTKDCNSEEMITAIRKVHVGQRYLHPDIAQHLALAHLKNDPDASIFELLSERELQVMIMITSGQKVVKISNKLCLSPKTINTYRYRLFEKLKVSTDVELTHLAIRHGLLDKELYTEELVAEE